MAKLLIIGCSDSKSVGGTKLENTTNDYFCDSLQEFRTTRKNQYEQKLIENPEYFNHGNGMNRPNYYDNAWSGDLYKRAIERYTGILYRDDLMRIYDRLINNGELHLLIVSDLYGLLRYDDQIKDYHYSLNNTQNINTFARRHLTPAIINYIEENKIQKIGVALSETNYMNRIGINQLEELDVPLENLWIQAGGIAGLHATATSIYNWL